MLMTLTEATQDSSRVERQEASVKGKNVAAYPDDDLTDVYAVKIVLLSMLKKQKLKEDARDDNEKPKARRKNPF